MGFSRYLPQSKCGKLNDTVVISRDALDSLAGAIAA
jgi:hypothetical protein